MFPTPLGGGRLRACSAVLSALAFAGALTACGGGGSSAPAGGGDAVGGSLSAVAALGEKIFKDPSLSASGRQSCASCHDAAFAHAQPNGLATQLGGPGLDRQGGRLSPSIRYLATNQAFFFAADGTPTGGFFWDGRAGSLRDQAGKPFLNPAEMANASKAEVVGRLASAPYAGEFRRVFGDAILADAEGAFQRITLALQQYQLEDPDFRPYSSKYDAFLLGKARLEPQELRGLALFNNPAKGNCLACHPSGRGADGSLPLFTDFTYDSLGVPRNPELRQNDDPGFYDLGLCAREGGDLAGRAELCGKFKVPSLRNVALRQAFFHNGRFKTLKDVLAFYVQRDTNPEKWYPVNADGSVRKFDDLPERYRGNVNVAERPYNRKPGDAPALDDAEIDDLIA
ncbi:MAG: cytochrome-c peroxidase, partial [Proteobacteria bacterium]|nr:cytochrome-c peroxidase [Pseudomonadota bacterium]